MCVAHLEAFTDERSVGVRHGADVLGGAGDGVPTGGAVPAVGQTALPAYAPGNDYPNATAFAMDSVREYPPWFALNYEPVRGRGQWYDLQEFRPNACTGRASGVQCHEWPWASTHQGGDPDVYSLPRISDVMPLARSENAGEGGKYSRLIVGRCALGERYAVGGWQNAPFLTVPQMQRPTFAVCGSPVGG